ncbi:MAG TPA: hypothetical protein P5228_07470 [Bacteroidales bacterium]|nr:hypothetical protein [Bacteroidales bacterium]HRZ49940.1 hypothetical protein [Bacteroidales bacterium]
MVRKPCFANPALIMLFMFITMLPVHIRAQEMSEFREYEDSLAVLSQKVFQGSDEAARYEANEAFISLLAEALSLNNSFRYPFDSLKTVNILPSPDKRFRLITWMLAKDDGTYQYFGFIQAFSRRKNDYEVYFLTDLADKSDAPEMRILDHKNWYGAVYYNIILTRYNGNRYYTLLGWEGHNRLTTKKVIEVMTLRSNGMPRFGQSLFRYGQPQQKRVIFEYSALASMNLRYEKQHYYIKKKKLFARESSPGQHRRNPSGDQRKPGIFSFMTRWMRQDAPKPRAPRGYRLSRKAADMIVLDHLVPLNPSVTGQRQFYVPEGNIMCGFVFDHGKWKYIEDIDARNPAHRYDKPSKRPKPERGL